MTGVAGYRGKVNAGSASVHHWFIMVSRMTIHQSPEERHLNFK